ncbi:MAG TPA: glucose-6-phosphate dehydrogenase assembly protein OpcA [Candidatus Eremiobacteraceae bacterium]|nr:glucose-6-phosphate dehydrogenase assembly protein OpcA [Candidatus Eremiobacteraceae bacterium]
MAQAVKRGDGVAAPAFDGLKPVAPAQVEAELTKRLADSGVAAGEAPSRACTLNLVVYVERASEIMQVAEAIRALEASHPMRVLLVTLDSGAPADRVQTWVDVECSDCGQVCSEQIVLRGNPDASARIVSTVLALLVADLPVALWWRSDSPYLSRLFRGLAPLADKIVVDSIRFGDGPAALDTLHRLAWSDRRARSDGRDRARHRAPIADMNWYRIATWRSTLSACFDDPAVLAFLPSIDKSEIEFSLGPQGGDSPPSARSLLLAGWIVSRMPAIAGHGDLSGVPSDWATHGAIVALRLRSSASRAGVSIEWKSDKVGIDATAFGAGGVPMRRWRFEPDPEDEADLLYSCIDSMSPDPVLEAALEVG